MSIPVDIVLPCYNPDDTWPDELLNFHRSAGEGYELRYIVVNDGSRTGDIAAQIKYLQEKQIRVRLISYEKNMGKGYALRQGVNGSTAPHVVYTDIDFPFSNESMNAMLSLLTSGQYDIVAGYRNENYYMKSMSLFRKKLSRAFRFFIRKFLRMPFTDTQCGLKGFNSKGKRKFLETQINRYLFDFEFMYTAMKDREVSIGSVQVMLKDDIVFSKMKARILLQETMNLARVLLFRAR